MKAIIKTQIETMKTLGIETEGLSYEKCVENLLNEHILLMQEIEQDNIEFFKRNLRLVSTQPTN